MASRHSSFAPFSPYGGDWGGISYSLPMGEGRGGASLGWDSWQASSPSPFGEGRGGALSGLPSPPSSCIAIIPTLAYRQRTFATPSASTWRMISSSCPCGLIIRCIASASTQAPVRAWCMPIATCLISYRWATSSPAMQTTTSTQYRSYNCRRSPFQRIALSSPSAAM